MCSRVMDTTTERYAEDVVSSVAATLRSNLIGAYIHGSAVLGGFDSRRSDVDIIVVCKRPMNPAEKQEAAAGVASKVYHVPPEAWN